MACARPGLIISFSFSKFLMSVCQAQKVCKKAENIDKILPIKVNKGARSRDPVLHQRPPGWWRVSNLDPRNGFNPRKAKFFSPSEAKIFGVLLVPNRLEMHCFQYKKYIMHTKRPKNSPPAVLVNLQLCSIMLSCYVYLSTQSRLRRNSIASINLNLACNRNKILNCQCRINLELQVILSAIWLAIINTFQS